MNKYLPKVIYLFIFIFLASKLFFFVMSLRTLITTLILQFLCVYLLQYCVSLLCLLQN